MSVSVSVRASVSASGPGKSRWERGLLGLARALLAEAEPWPLVSESGYELVSAK